MFFFHIGLAFLFSGLAQRNYTQMSGQPVIVHLHQLCTHSSARNINEINYVRCSRVLILWYDRLR